MIDPRIKLKWRRRLRKGKKQVASAGSETDIKFERYFIRRLERLTAVRRFVFSWVTLLVLILIGLVVQHRQLQPYYQEVAAVSGGTYREGILGTFSGLNPMYASGPVDGAVSKLVFSGLYTYDQFNQLQPDLAVDVELDESELEYTVRLRDDVYWHDGERFDADDVIFTYETISNPDARSPLFSGWRDIEVDAVDKFTVTFTLPNPFAPFLYTLDNGIVPEHILADVPPSQLRSHIFNTIEPIGTGPFELEAVEVVGLTQEAREERIALGSYESYHRGQPELDTFVIRTYRSRERLVESFAARDVHAISGLDSIDEELFEDLDYTSYVVPLTGQIGVFFKTSQLVFSERDVRRALVASIDAGQVLAKLEGPVVPVRSPLLPIHSGYDENTTQQAYDPELAVELLEKQKWKQNADGIWEKDGEELAFRVAALNNTDSRAVMQELQDQWHTVGVKVDVAFQDEEDLQATISGHEYTALLHGISLGPDADVFAFWHSSQADILAENRLNLSDYASEVADEALESGRTRLDEALRDAKYQSFVEEWIADVPALLLYQPRYMYVAQYEVDGFYPIVLNSGTDRMYSAHEWKIRRDVVNRQE